MTSLPSAREDTEPSDTSSVATSSTVAGSTAVTNEVLPSTRKPFCRNGETVATSGSAATRSATSGLNEVNELVESV